MVEQSITLGGVVTFVWGLDMSLIDELVMATDGLRSSVIVVLVVDVLTVVMVGDGLFTTLPFLVRIGAV